MDIQAFLNAERDALMDVNINDQSYFNGRMDQIEKIELWLRSQPPATGFHVFRSTADGNFADWTWKATFAEETDAEFYAGSDSEWGGLIEGTNADYADDLDEPRIICRVLLASMPAPTGNGVQEA